MNQPFLNVRLSMTNCFLLKGANGYLMVDCGGEQDEKALRRFLKNHHIRLDSIRYLFLTHHHSDHCGLLRFLKTNNPEMTIIMSETCAEYIATGHHYVPQGERFSSVALDVAFRLFRKFGANVTDAFPVYSAQAGDILVGTDPFPLPDRIGIQATVISTPGHTPDSIALIVGNNVFAGDSVTNLFPFSGAARKPILLYNPSLCRESRRKLTLSGAAWIHPSHGKSFPVKALKGL